MSSEIEALLRAKQFGGPVSPPNVSKAAAEAGLLDVAYAFEDSPVGRLLLAVTPRGLVRVSYVEEGHDAVLASLAARISPRVLEAPLDGPRRELEEFFAGRRKEFELPIDWQLVGSAFAKRVLLATSRIPYGESSSYGEIAREAGNVRAHRAAGTALGRNPLPIVVPCHRVLKGDGAIGNYAGGVQRKLTLLAVEQQ
jgi:methylated-DNA-[protein]-cysteine S-methyltransferase